MPAPQPAGVAEVPEQPIIHLDTISSRALRAFNEQLHDDQRVDLSMVPIGEGLTLLGVR